MWSCVWNSGNVPTSKKGKGSLIKGGGENKQIIKTIKSYFHPSPHTNTVCPIAVRSLLSLWWPVFTMWWSWVMVSQICLHQNRQQALRGKEWCSFFDFIIYVHYDHFSVCARRYAKDRISNDCIFLRDFDEAGPSGVSMLGFTPDCRHQIQ